MSIDEIQLRRSISQDLQTLLTAERSKSDLLFLLAFQRSNRWVRAIQRRIDRIIESMRLMDVGSSKINQKLLEELIQEFEPSTWEYIVSFVITGFNPNRRYHVKDQVYNNLKRLQVRLITGI